MRAAIRDPDALRRLYVDDGLTAGEIAARLGCGASTVLRGLRALGIARRPRGPAPRRGREADGVWTPELAYAVGLIATDGNLATRKRRVSLVSKDLDQIQTFLRCTNVEASIGRHRSGSGRLSYRVQCGRRSFYDWLIRIGLTPAKSSTLGALDIPDEYFRDFLRGCVDGDGSITTYVDRSHAAKNPTYVYTRIYVSLVSASPRFLEWISGRVRMLTEAAGSITVRRDVLCARRSKPCAEACRGGEVSRCGTNPASTRAGPADGSMRTVAVH